MFLIPIIIIICMYHTLERTFGGKRKRYLGKIYTNYLGFQRTVRSSWSRQYYHGVFPEARLAGSWVLCCMVILYPCGTVRTRTSRRREQPDKTRQDKRRKRGGITNSADPTTTTLAVNHQYHHTHTSHPKTKKPCDEICRPCMRKLAGLQKRTDALPVSC
ncbi:hypothetical protein F4820DRAFT_355312 [Hypoxylon rubiginosum]|uniref:Uncharacterized protein n=1 Tax=Hypoxylon rubiginosum TaxID=110542 RepID=A0ACB9YX12_9PEZI|nr:hypothetical protein F4820DRAFT_355312 [Hypoxylon rubiginosum]